MVLILKVTINHTFYIIELHSTLILGKYYIGFIFISEWLRSQLYAALILKFLRNFFTSQSFRVRIDQNS